LYLPNRSRNINKCIKTGHDSIPVPVSVCAYTTHAFVKVLHTSIFSPVFVPQSEWMWCADSAHTNTNKQSGPRCDTAFSYADAPMRCFHNYVQRCAVQTKWFLSPQLLVRKHPPPQRCIPRLMDPLESQFSPIHIPRICIYFNNITHSRLSSTWRLLIQQHAIWKSRCKELVQTQQQSALDQELASSAHQS
jgi:mannosyltransferase OCH1-like enzyme